MQLCFESTCCVRNPPAAKPGGSWGDGSVSVLGAVVELLRFAAREALMLPLFSPGWLIRLSPSFPSVHIGINYQIEKDPYRKSSTATFQ